VGVDIGSLAAFAADEIVDRHVGHAAFDIPEGLIDAADGVVEHRAVFPVRAVVAGLPDVFDLIDGVVFEEGLQVAIDGGLDEVGALGEGGTAVAVEAVLIGGDFDDVEADAGGAVSMTVMSLILGRESPRTAFSTVCWAFSSRGVRRVARPALAMDLRMLRRFIWVLTILPDRRYHELRSHGMGL